MVRVTVSVEGEPDEVRDALERLLHRELETIPGGDTLLASPEHESGAERQRQTPEVVEMLWGRIKPDAREIWGEIAKRPEGYPFKELQRAVGLSGLQVAGRLSSIGHAMNAFPGVEHPIIKDYGARVYRMDPELAEAVRRLALSES